MRIIEIADIHNGTIKDTVYIYRTITDIFDLEIGENKSDMIVFLGDFFHRLFKLNEEYVRLCIEIVQYLVMLCKKTGCKIRFIYGTESHEMNQYVLFKPFFDDPKVDIKLIQTVTEEEINDKKILYLPEEYVDSKHEYYKDTLYSDKHYDYIFGHGVIAEGITMVHESTDRQGEKKVPIFKSAELSSRATITSFGHYHIYTELDNVYYIGSLFRTSFGEETPKVYGIIEDDKFSTVENDQAYSYNTYTFEADSPIYQDPEVLDKELKRIMTLNVKVLDGVIGGKIRFIFNLPPNYELSETFRENIRNLLGNNSKIAYLTHSNIIDEIEDTQIVEEYDFIFDKNLPIEDKLMRYIDKNYDTVMSLDDIKEIIYDEFKL